MADFNKVLLIGRLTRDPQLKFLPSQTAICEFGLATGRKWRTPQGEEREETTFVDCSLFGKGAEIFNQYCQNGKLVFLEGRLKLDTWDDKQTGQKRSKMSVVVENFQFLGGRNEGGPPSDDGSGAGGAPRQSYGRPGGYGGGGGGGSGGGGSRGPARQQQQPAPADAEPPYNDEQQFKDDDIPF
jgi:single-strand DNA-binding protein